MFEKRRRTSDDDHDSLIDSPTLKNKLIWIKQFIQENIKTSTKDKEKKSFTTVTFFQLFRYADKCDRILLIIGFLSSIIQGLIYPLTLYFTGRLCGIFAQRVFDQCLSIETSQCPLGIEINQMNYNHYHKFCSNNITQVNSIHDDYSYFHQEIVHLIYQLIGCASIQLIAAILNSISFLISSQRQTNRIRQLLFDQMINKNLMNFNQYSNKEFYLKLLSNLNQISLGIGEKLSIFLSTCLYSVFGMFICFYIYWPLTFILMILILANFLLITYLSKIISKTSVDEMRAYAKAGSVAQEGLSALRTILINNAIEFIIDRYTNHLNNVRKYTMKKSVLFGLIYSTMKLSVYLFYIITLLITVFLFGQLDEKDQPSIDNILTIITISAICLTLINQAGAYSIFISEAKGAAVDVFKILDEDQSTNDDIHHQTKKNKFLDCPSSFEKIEFVHVNFVYPSRPDLIILNDLNMSITRGQLVALVGHSGSGKSSCLQLLSRFYEVTSGEILFDGINIKNYSPDDLRKYISIVNQDSALFSTTIYENILYGNDQATEDDIIQAAKQANAHSFIMTLPNKYQTRIGERGLNLSGGEKQRIALARALIQQTPILLFDEATSALDNHSEQLFHQTLFDLSQTRLILLITHRLLTIRHCSQIYLLDHGHIIESGNHQTLMNNRQFYFQLIQTQQRENISQIQSDLFIGHNQITNSKAIPLNDRNKLSLNIQRKTTTTIKYPFFRLLQLARPEYTYIIIGSIICFIYGGFDVILSFLLGYVATVLQECHRQKQQEDIQSVCLLLFLLGIVTYLINICLHVNFAIVGTTFLKRLRIKALRSYFHQDMSWHDREENNSTTLCVRLCTDADDVKRLLNIRIIFVLQAIGTLSLGTIIGLILNWKLMFIVLIQLSIYTSVVITIIYLTEQNNLQSNQMIEKTTTLAIECLTNIQIIHQLRKTKYFSIKHHLLIDQSNISKKRICLIGILSGIRHSVGRFAIAILYVVGLHLIHNHQLELDQMTIVLVYGIYISFATTVTEMAAAEIGRTGTASRNFVDLFERQSSIMNSQSSNEIKPNSFNGHLNFNDVSFSYPTRPHVKIFNHLSMQTNPGQTIALIGPSGCGKSSIVQLIARFYDVDSGNLLIDGIDIRSLNIDWWRSQISLVSQDPIVFNTTIRENILFGCQYQSTSLPTLDEIIETTKLVNIHDFICSLPQGYETNIGMNGNDISGGEKQRLVLARCLLRQSQLLIFDEATSALDTMNEQLIEQALVKIRLNKSVIIIAHRLSTVRQCDCIYVFNDQGEIIESGTHQTLLTYRGIYYRMINEIIQ